MTRILALDVGEKRVGVAISDASGTIARPLHTIPQHPRPDQFAVIEAIVDEHDVCLVVVGYPVNLDGTEGPQARRVARYLAALADRLRVPVVPWDERYSTTVAQDLLRQSKGARRHGEASRVRSRRDRIDAVAACVILQAYLDSHRQEGSCGWHSSSRSLETDNAQGASGQGGQEEPLETV